MDNARIQAAIEGVDYPASRDDLLQQARANDTDDEVIDVLQRLPALTFASPTEVTSQLATSS
ncbi:MAG: DUF2795 domain-containing protein [Nitriliruptorales bacterium]|nr:DUF2795 domain-containing protein [Nitriliruptorales bacterium]